MSEAERARQFEAGITIRELAQADADAYCTLFARVFSQPPWNERWEITDIGAGLSRSTRKRGFLGLIAEAGPTGIGYLTGFMAGLPGILPIFYIEQLFVSPDFRSQGVGRRLIGQAERRLAGRKVSAILLLTKPSSPSEAFYLRNGYLRLPLLRVRGKSVLYKSQKQSHPR